MEVVEHPANPFVTYTLIDPDNAANHFDVIGSDYLSFNDGTYATFHDTYVHVQRTHGVSKCFVVQSGMWYQLMFENSEVRQYSYNGATTRRIVCNHHNVLLDGGDIHTNCDMVGPVGNDARTQMALDE